MPRPACGPSRTVLHLITSDPADARGRSGSGVVPVRALRGSATAGPFLIGPHPSLRTAASKMRPGTSPGEGPHGTGPVGSAIAGPQKAAWGDLRTDAPNSSRARRPGPRPALPVCPGPRAEGGGSRAPSRGTHPPSVLRPGPLKKRPRFETNPRPAHRRRGAPPAQGQQRMDTATARLADRVLLKGRGGGGGGGLSTKRPKVCVPKRAQVNRPFRKISFVPAMKSGSEAEGIVDRAPPPSRAQHGTPGA